MYMYSHFKISYCVQYIHIYFSKKMFLETAVMLYTHNPNTQEAEVQVQSQPEQRTRPHLT